MQDDRIYAGIFANEPGQLLLHQSMAQIDATLGTAWTACQCKEDKLAVFHKCIDLLDTMSDKLFEDETDAFLSTERVNECLRQAFVGYVRQVYRSSKKQVRVSVPTPSAYVQTLLTVAAKAPQVRSGQYFQQQSSIERKDIMMDVIRQTTARLCSEYVLEEDPVMEHFEQSSAADDDDVAPEDSASQIGEDYRGRDKTGGVEHSEHPQASERSLSSGMSDDEPPPTTAALSQVRSERTHRADHKSVTIKAASSVRS